MKKRIILDSQRVQLRPIKITDTPFIFEIRSNPKNCEYFGIIPYQTIEEACAFVNQVISDMEQEAVYFFVIELKKTNEPIGTICLWSFNHKLLRAEVGYELLESKQGNGYAFEALSVIVEFAKSTLDLSSLDGITHSHHQASLSILFKSGFDFVGKIKDVYPNSKDNPLMEVYRLNMNKKE